jgi:hypothetical protein
MSVEAIADFFSNIRDRGLTVKENFNYEIRYIQSFRQKADIGFLFYTMQDCEAACISGELYLSWGSYNDDELAYLTVANAILDEAQACSLKSSWSSSIHTKIKLSNLDKIYFADKIAAAEHDLADNVETASEGSWIEFDPEREQEWIEEAPDDDDDSDYVP